MEIYIENNSLECGFERRKVESKLEIFIIRL